MRVCLLVYALVVCYAQESYRKHKIVRVVPRNEQHLRILRSLDSLLGHEIDYLREVRSLDKPADMLLNPDDHLTVEDVLQKNDIEYLTVVDDVSRSIRRERRSVAYQTTPYNITYDYITSKYIPFDDQIRLVEETLAMYPGFTKALRLGSSTQGRPILGIQFGFPKNTTKPILWIDSGIHAREWIAHSAALYAIWRFGHDQTVQNVLRDVDVVIMPNVNPDGYENSRTTDRMWRKTMSVHPGSNCRGVDANRNYPFHFGEEGVSNDPCSEVFCGPYAMSEPEVRAVAEAVLAKKELIRGYIALHSYGQDILYPWGHQMHTYPPDVEQLKNVGLNMARAINAVSGTKYTVANSADGLYPASGAADDWSKSIGVKYAYTYELSPKGDNFGFDLPERFIESVGKEIFAGLLRLADQIAEDETGQRPFRRWRVMDVKDTSIKRRSQGRG